MNNQQAAHKINDRPIVIITAIVLAASAICLIVNYSVNHAINWSLFPIGALIVVWATVIPVLIMNNNKWLGLILGLAITIVPYLFLIQSLTSTKGWVIQLAIPIVVLALIALSLSLAAFRYIKTNKYYPIALTIFLFGVVVNYGVGIILSRFLNGRNMDDIPRALTMSASALISLMFLASAIIKGSETDEQVEYIQ